MEPSLTKKTASPSSRSAPQYWKADLALLGLAVIWGYGFVPVKNIMGVLPPISFVALRFGIASVLLIMTFFKRLRFTTRAEIGVGSLLGLFLGGGYTFQNFGIRHTQPVAARLQPDAPDRQATVHHRDRHNRRRDGEDPSA